MHGRTLPVMGRGDVPRSDRWPRMTRAAFLDFDEQRILRDWGHALRRVFPDAVGIMHVGSSVTRPDYRDVDVRVVLHDDAFAALSSVIQPDGLGVALSLWGKRVTGLRVDCQVQAMSSQPDGKRRPLA